MKKTVTSLMLVALATAAYAQNPDGLKQVMSAEKYSDAKELVKGTEGTMTNAEKAKAYNKLVDLAVADNTKAEEKALKAQVSQDAAEMAAQNIKKAKAAYNALQAAFKCNEYDQQPNDKGKVSPKFQKKNVDRLLAVRNSLINPALEAYNSKDYNSAKKYFGTFVEARQNPLFANADFSQEKNYGQVAYYASLAALLDKDYKKASQYADIAIASGEAEPAKDAINIKINALNAQVKDGKLSKDKLEEQLKAFYDKNPDNETIFTNLYNAYTDNGKKEQADALINSRLASNPNDVMANALKGQNAQNAEDFTTAIEAYNNALKAKPDFLAVKTNIGICYLTRAANAADKNTNDRGQLNPQAKPAIVEDLNQAKKVLEEVKAADPDQAQAKWSFALERTNYILENIK